MASLVNLNVPPRLIESARAAQYANREALNSRELDARIKAKAEQRHAAALRAQPLPDDRVGGVLEFQQRPMGRIRTRRQVVRQVEAGLGWSHQDGNASLIDTRIYIQSGDGSRVVSFSRRPDNWDGMGSSIQADLPGGGRKLQLVDEVDYVLPVDENSFLYLLVISTPTLTYTSAISGGTAELTAAPYAQGCLVSQYEARRVSVPVPAFALRHLIAEGPVDYANRQRYYFEYLNPRYYGLGWRRLDDGPVDNHPFPAGSAVPFRVPLGLSGLTSFRSASSAVYMALGTARSADVTAEEVQQDFERSGGIGEIPVINVSYNKNWFLRESGQEIMTAGLLSDATVFDPLLKPYPSSGQPYEPYDIRPPYFLQDSQAWYWGSFNPVITAEGLTSFTNHIVAYDYHGGTYCRDRLAELGITL